MPVTKPSEADGRIFFENYGKVQSFTKTNGLGDDKRYTIEYEVTLTCSKQNASPPDPRYIRDLDEGFTLRCYSIGQKIQKAGRLAFEKTEKGWRVILNASN